MKKNLTAGGIIMVLLMSSAIFAQASTYQVDVDKGEVVIQFDKDQTEAISYSITVPNHCPGTIVNTTESNNKIKFVHAGNRCEKGAEIVVKINPSVKDLKLSLKAGALIVSPKSRQASQTIDAKVNAGLIMSSFLTKKRTSNYAGEVGSYQSRESDQTLTLDLKVESGVISVN